MNSTNNSGGGDNFPTVPSLKRPYTARAFTYAEKIELMKQQNDHDVEFITKHLRTTASPSPVTTDSNTTPKLEKEVTKHHHTKKRDDEAYGEHGHHRKKTARKSNVGASKGRNRAELQMSGRNASKIGEISSRTTPPLSTAKSISVVVTSDEPASVSAASMPSMTLPPSTSAANLFPSEYYGSGEWATAAMETIKNLQSTMEHRPQISESYDGNFVVDQRNCSRSSSSKLLFDAISQAAADHPSALLEKQDVVTQAAAISQVAAQLTLEKKEAAKSAAVTAHDTNNNNNDEVSGKASTPPLTTTTSAHKPHRAAARPHHQQHRAATQRSSELHSARESNGQRETTRKRADDSEARDDVGRSQSPKRSRLVRMPEPLLFAANKQQAAVDNSREQSKSLLETHLLKSRQQSSCSVPKSSSDPAMSCTNASLLRDENNMKFNKLHETLAATTASSSQQHHVGAGGAGEGGGEAVARCGDALTFLDDVERHGTVMMRYDRKRDAAGEADNSRTANSSGKVNVPEVFRNCIETYMKVKLIEKVRVCRVCGYSVKSTTALSDTGLFGTPRRSRDELGDNANDDGAKDDDALLAHVMEHSLKELYQIGGW